MMSEHGALPKKPRAEGNAGRIKLREMQLPDIMLPHKFCSHESKSWRKHTLANSRCNRHTNDLHAIHHLFARKGRIILRGHHSNLMTTFDKCTSGTLSISGESAGVRAIVRENGK